MATHALIFTSEEVLQIFRTLGTNADRQILAAVQDYVRKHHGTALPDSARFQKHGYDQGAIIADLKSEPLKQ